MDCGEATILVAFDISAAFDMVVHSTLLQRLRNTFGVDDVALKWIESYLSRRNQFVKIGSATSQSTSYNREVPQCSVLCPILFTVYASPTAKVAVAHGVAKQQYADDTQLHVILSKLSLTTATRNLEDCVTALRRWFAENGLALNSDKSKAMLVLMAQRSKEFSSLRTVSAAGSSVTVASQIRLLGATLNVNLNFNTQIKNVFKASYFHIRALRHFRSSVTEDMANSIACALMQSRFDYANVLYAGT